jgi:hypothetical protein
MVEVLLFESFDEVFDQILPFGIWSASSSGSSYHGSSENKFGCIELQLHSPAAWFGSDFLIHFKPFVSSVCMTLSIHSLEQVKNSAISTFEKRMNVLWGAGCFPQFLQLLWVIVLVIPWNV